MLKPKFFSIVKHHSTELSKEQILKDVVAGIIVAIIALPLSVALAIASGVSPEKGLITSIIAGFLISFLGGSRVQIGGPTAAFVVIVYGIIDKYGIKGLTIATIMSGIFLIVLGLFHFGSLIKYIPYPITTGFTSGIALTLLATQVKDFLGLSINKVPAEFIPKIQSYITHFSTISIATLAIGILSLLIIILWPKINKTIPGSLMALVIATILVKVLHLPVETIGSRFGQISSAIPKPHIIACDLNTIKALIQPAITIAILAAIESLLSAVVADGMIGKKHNSNMELIAQGVANIGSALFGGIPATGAIARTAANIKNGGRTPIAGMVHAVTLFLIMIIFMPFAKLIPMTTLAAILISVAYNMSQWRAFKAILSAPKSDVAVLLITFTFTVVFDLVVAIEIGMVFALFIFMKSMADSTTISRVHCNLKNYNDDDDSDENDDISTEKLSNQVVTYHINGPLFFGAVQTFMDVISEVKSTSDILILRMGDVPMMDVTAFDMLKRVDERCRKNHIMLLFADVQDQPMQVMSNSGFVEKLGEDRFFNKFDDALKTANEILRLKVHVNTKRTARE